MIINDDPNVYDRNDYHPIIKLTHKNNKNEVVPTTGLTDLYIWIAAVDDGAEIHAELKALATELAIPGYYEVILVGASIHTRMFATPPTYDKKDVFIIARNNASNVNTSERVQAHAIRRTARKV